MSRVFWVTWPIRRRWAAVALLPAVAALFASAAGAWASMPGPVWTALLLLAAATAALVLASYVPERGRRLEMGCTPCGVLAGMTVLGATLALRNYGAGIEGPAVALAVTLFGLTQRLTQPATCPTPTRV